MVRYVNFLKRIVLARLISSDRDDDPYVQFFYNVANAYAVEKGISLEEGVEQIYDALRDSTDKDIYEQAKALIEGIELAKEKYEQEWGSEEKEKYPLSYMLEKIQEKLKESSGQPV